MALFVLRLSAVHVPGCFHLGGLFDVQAYPPPYFFDFSVHGVPPRLRDEYNEYSLTVSNINQDG